jgi:hypothetical protein
MSLNEAGRHAPGRVWLPVAALAAAGFLVFGPASARAAQPDEDADTPAAAPAPHRLALGVNYTGEQIRLHITRDWAVEERVMTGSASSNSGRISSLVFGLRGYRFFQEHYHCKLYLGLEGDYAMTKVHNAGESNDVNGGTSYPSGFGNTTGYDAGGFGGIEFRFMRRVAVDIDMGPYVINLKEKVTSTSASAWDFVLNTALVIYLF